MHFHYEGVEYEKNILRGFFRGHPFCLHEKFQVSYSTPSRFVKKMTYFCIIFVEKYFFAKFLRFYTSTKNFSKIRPKISKRQPIKKKNFFYLFPLLTYSALDTLLLVSPNTVSPWRLHYTVAGILSTIFIFFSECVQFDFFLCYKTLLG